MVVILWLNQICKKHELTNVNFASCIVFKKMKQIALYFANFKHEQKTTLIHGKVGYSRILVPFSQKPLNKSRSFVYTIEERVNKGFTGRNI